MDKQHLQDLLQSLHADLEHGEPVDAENRELLAKVLADIRHVLDQPPTGQTEEHHSLVDRLRDVTQHLEESHPRLTSTTEQLIEALSRIFQ